MTSEVRQKRRIPEELRPRAQGECVFHPNPKVHRMLRTPVWVPWLVYLPLVGIAFALGAMEFGVPVVKGILLFFLGWFVWTFTEYMVHRFLYHTETRWEWFRRFQMRAHGIHHQHPKDPYCLAMPIFMSIFLAGGTLALFWWILREDALPFWGGFAFGYLVYLFIHYAQHRWTPEQVPSVFMPLWKHHVIHHYKDPFSNFGVSTRLWDFVFGTMHREEKKSRK